jgi:hypothetical protein
LRQLAAHVFNAAGRGVRLDLDLRPAGALERFEGALRKAGLVEVVKRELAAVGGDQLKDVIRAVVRQRMVRAVAGDVTRCSFRKFPGS